DTPLAGTTANPEWLYGIRGPDLRQRAELRDFGIADGNPGALRTRYGWGTPHGRRGEKFWCRWVLPHAPGENLAGRYGHPYQDVAPQLMSSHGHRSFR